ncbi:hypothetical protein [Actinokineospora sp. UTMC 2448]|uniref:hypothetical protein n=1 Tax=Actinokineospora sp. UTMC 2448 TaxID=2268449 RepID=UPI0021649E41|nr:hypothetical protein [Actinokineospora sp. UTMC 2448]
MRDLLPEDGGQPAQARDVLPSKAELAPAAAMHEARQTSSPTVTVGLLVSVLAEGVVGQVSDACEAASSRG